MRAYLQPLIEQGKIDVEEEFQQACFHISVYKSYAPDHNLQRYPRHRPLAAVDSYIRCTESKAIGPLYTSMGRRPRNVPIQHRGLNALPKLQRTSRSVGLSTIHADSSMVSVPITVGAAIPLSSTYSNSG